MVGSLAMFSSLAIMPEQLVEYVRAVSSLQSCEIGGCLLHYQGTSGVLAAYPQNIYERSTALESRLENIIDEATKKYSLRQITLLTPLLPGKIPAHAAVKKDSYWFIDAPSCVPTQKVRNLLRRARREIAIETAIGDEAWTKEHSGLVENLRLRKKGALEEGMLHIFGRLKKYLGMSSEARLFSARTASGKLVGCAIADFTALETAFYMFSFRDPNAPPGTADALLFEIIGEAKDRGHRYINLGLGIDAGVEFFKKKWGAKPLLPYNEVLWRINNPKNSWLKKFFWKGPL